MNEVLVNKVVSATGCLVAYKDGYLTLIGCVKPEVKFALADLGFKSVNGEVCRKRVDDVNKLLAEILQSYQHWSNTFTLVNDVIKNTDIDMDFSSWWADKKNKIRKFLSLKKDLTSPEGVLATQQFLGEKVDDIVNNLEGVFKAADEWLDLKKNELLLSAKSLAIGGAKTLGFIFALFLLGVWLHSKAKAEQYVVLGSLKKDQLKDYDDFIELLRTFDVADEAYDQLYDTVAELQEPVSISSQPYLNTPVDVVNDEDEDSHFDSTNNTNKINDANDLINDGVR